MIMLTNQQKFHVPVMLEEVLRYLRPSPGAVIIDATLGTGGHSLAIAEGIMPSGRLVGLDRDEESISLARDRLAAFGQICTFVHGNFSNIDEVLRNLKIKKVDGILFDLGVSSFQLGNPERGFSFQSEGPLDMRLDRKSYISAYDLVNNLNEEEISNMLWTFGQERWHNRIARFLVQERQRHPISTTLELSDIVFRAVPYAYRHYRIHPATRTFQAVRIAVNRELEALDQAISKAIDFMSPDARICVISFHSLEDRIIKLNFRKAASAGLVEILTPKPLGTKEAEIRHNPASRSAKLRVARRI